MQINLRGITQHSDEQVAKLEPERHSHLPIISPLGRLLPTFESGPELGSFGSPGLILQGGRGRQGAALAGSRKGSTLLGSPDEGAVILSRTWISLSTDRDFTEI